MRQFRQLLNILAACVIVLLAATPIVMGATTSDSDLKEVPGAQVIYYIVDTLEGFGVAALTIGLMLGILILIIGLFTHPKATLVGLVVFLIVFVLVVALWQGRDDIINGFLKELGYVLPERAT